MHALIKSKMCSQLQNCLFSFHALCLRSLLLCKTGHALMLLAPVLVCILQLISALEMCYFHLLFPWHLSQIIPSMRNVNALFYAPVPLCTLWSTSKCAWAEHAGHWDQIFWHTGTHTHIVVCGVASTTNNIYPIFGDAREAKFDVAIHEWPLIYVMSLRLG